MLVGIFKAIIEFSEMSTGEKISDPDRAFVMKSLPLKIVKIIKVNNSKVIMTRKSLKHIVERQKWLTKVIMEDINRILITPTKITNNSVKRENSFLFAKMNGKAKALVLEIKKNNNSPNQVVSAFFMDKKTYDKLEDISGRSDVPPSR